MMSKLLLCSVTLFLSFLSFDGKIESAALLPNTVALSIADDPPEHCVHTPPTLTESSRKKNVSVCFSAVKERTNQTQMNWRRMTVTFEQEVLSVTINLRRVPVFAAGAIFQMAGGATMSVYSLIRDLFPELFVSYFNGFGSSAGILNNSVLFTGQINDRLFEGQIIYHNTGARHSLQCSHNTTPVSDFHLLDRCIQCQAFMPSLGQSLSSPLGWRTVSSPACKNDSVEAANAALLGRGVDPHENASESSERHPDNVMVSSAAESSLPPIPHYTKSDSDLLTTEEELPERQHDPADSESGVIAKTVKSTRSRRMAATSEDAKQMTGDALLDAVNAGSEEEKRVAIERLGTASGSSSIHRVLKRSNGSRATRSINPLAAGSSESATDRDFSQRDDTARSEPPSKTVVSTIPLVSDGSSNIVQGITPSAKVRMRSHGQTDTRRSERRWGSRKTRSAENGGTLKDSMQTTSCSLHLVADHLFFSEIGGSSPAKTVNLMLAIVMGADALFRSTDFNGDGLSDSIGFLVKNITIIRSPDTAFYSYSRSNSNAFQYLKSFSTADFSDVCLGVAFTAIDFERGVVGLAWYASSTTVGLGKGGICAQRVRLPNEKAEFSFNTAIVTFINHGTTVSMERAILTVAHEFGHCFGSSHDDDTKDSGCSQSLETGSYLMQRYRPAQYHPNSYLFSPCSVRQIYPVIVRKGSCLIRYAGPSCGNGVLEEGEECDCGMTASACQFSDPCCTPADAPPSSADRPCTFRRSEGMQCSPVIFSCCSASCRYITEAEQVVCREESDCYSRSTCDGSGPRCPSPTLKPDGWPCHGNVRTCVGGRCQDSPCRRSGLHDCFCSDLADDQCKLCCREAPGLPCRASRAFNIVDSTGQDILLLDGDACLDYRGVCSSSSSSSGNGDASVGRKCVTDDAPEQSLAALLGSFEPDGPAARRSTWVYSSFIFVLPVSMFVVALRLKWTSKLTQYADRLKGSAARSRQMRSLEAAAHRQSHLFRQEVCKINAMCQVIYTGHHYPSLMGASTHKPPRPIWNHAGMDHVIFVNQSQHLARAPSPQHYLRGMEECPWYSDYRRDGAADEKLPQSVESIRAASGASRDGDIFYLRETDFRTRQAIFHSCLSGTGSENEQLSEIFSLERGKPAGEVANTSRETPTPALRQSQLTALTHVSHVQEEIERMTSLKTLSRPDIEKYGVEQFSPGTLSQASQDGPQFSISESSTASCSGGLASGSLSSNGSET